MTRWGQRASDFRAAHLHTDEVGLRTYLMASRIASSLLGLAQLAVLARVLTPAQFGTVAAATAAATYISMLGDPAVLGYERLGHHDPDRDHKAGEARSVANTMTVLLMTIAPLFALVVGLFTGDVLYALAVALWAVSLVQVRWMGIQYLNWLDQPRFATNLLVNSASRAGAMLVAALITGNGVTVLLSGAVASLLATGVAGPKRAPFSLHRGMLKRLLKVGGPMTIAAAAGQSMGSYPTLVGHAFLPTDVFANFAAQAGLAGAFYGATVGFVLVFGWPQAKGFWDSGDTDSAQAVVKRYTRYVLILGTASVAFMWVFGNILTRIILGPNYVGHTIPAYAVAAGCVGSLAMLAGWQMRLRYRQNLWAAIAVVFALVQLPVVWLATRNGDLVPMMLAVLILSWAETMVAIWVARSSRPILHSVYASVLALVAMACALAT